MLNYQRVPRDIQQKGTFQAFLNRTHLPPAGQMGSPFQQIRPKDYPGHPCKMANSSAVLEGQGLWHKPYQNNIKEPCKLDQSSNLWLFCWVKRTRFFPSHGLENQFPIVLPFSLCNFRRLAQLIWQITHTHTHTKQKKTDFADGENGQLREPCFL